MPTASSAKYQAIFRAISYLDHGWFIKIISLPVTVTDTLAVLDRGCMECRSVAVISRE